MNKKTHIMQIVYSLKMGGLENLVLQLVKSLDRSRYDCSICSLTDGGDLAKELEKVGIMYFSMNKKEGVDYGLHFRLANLLRRKKIDIVHTHNRAPFFYGAIAAKIARTPGIIHTEHSKSERREKRIKLMSKLLYRGINAVVADCKDVADNLFTAGGVSRDKIKTVLNGIDINKFTWPSDIGKKSGELGVDENSLVIGNIARLEVVKDHITLIESFKIINNLLPNTKLIIVGDGVCRQDLENYAKKLDINENVKFLGLRKDIAELMNTFDIFVLSSLSEGLSLTLIEAMAAGKPVIATNVGGNPEVVVNEVTGLLVPPNNPDKLANAILKLLRNPDLAKRMGEAGRKRVEEKFTLDRMVREYEELYEECFTHIKGVISH